MFKKSMILSGLLLKIAVLHGSHFNQENRPIRHSLNFDDSCLQIAHSLGLVQLDFKAKQKVFKIFQKIAQDRYFERHKESNLFKESVYAHARCLYRDHGDDFFEAYACNE